MKWTQYIEFNPQVLLGKPVIKGTRLGVDFILGLLAQGWTETQVLENYPQLNHEHILAVLSYAHERIESDKTFPLAT
jgi:uncharacterized protein (DUF433 family)